MIGKIALRNIRKNFSNYTVYFSTIIIGVAVFYLFNAITSQSVFQSLMKNNLGSYSKRMDNAFLLIGIVVAIVFAFLILYASSFLLKRRKKEFGIYLLVGMERKEITVLLLWETLLAGVFSLIIGLIVGILLSQGMSVFIARLFIADMSQFTFTFSLTSLLKTIGFFVLLSGIIFILDIVSIRHSQLVQLFSARKQNERQLKISRNLRICLPVFILSLFFIGQVYYTATIGSRKFIEWLVREEKNVDFYMYLEIVVLLAATFFLFWSLSGLILCLAKAGKRFYYKGLHAFTTKEISSRINTNIRSSFVICMLLTAALSIFSVCFSINREMNRSLEASTPVDAVFSTDYTEGLPYDTTPIRISQLLQSVNRLSLFKDSTQVTLYREYQWDAKEKMSIHSNENFFAGSGEIMTLSDYNKVAKRYGTKIQTLRADEYLVVANIPFKKKIYEKNYLSKGKEIQIGGKTLHPKETMCVDGFLDMRENTSNYGFTVIPDATLIGADIHPAQAYFMADYQAKNDAEQNAVEVLLMSNSLSNEIQKNTADENFYLSVTTKQDTRQKSIGLSSLIIFIGLYIGLIFLIACAAILSLKQLSQAVDSRSNYDILRKLGVDNKMIHRSLFYQNLIFFAVPAVPAICHALIAIQQAFGFLDHFDSKDLSISTHFGLLLFSVVYIGYLIVTHVQCKRIVS